MACFLSFGYYDLSEFSTEKKVAAVTADILTFPIVTAVISVAALALLLIKSLIKIIAYFLELCCTPLTGKTLSEVNFSENLGKLKLETPWAHLVLIPIIGSLIHGSLITHRARSEHPEEYDLVNSCVTFLGSSAHYLSKVIAW
ncbi:hypothetical protein BOKEGFJH_00332 [Chlamydia avium]|nr:hypothetical protein BOKEGFJH_00332 [Chlamydia avium]